MKKITLLLIAFFSCWQLQAQVSLYSFAQSNQTYTEITGGTVLGTSTTATSFDSQNWAIAAESIPFNFNYNGVNYTGCNVNSNGYITFGATLPTASTSAPISSTTAYAGAISAWGGDLVGVFVNNLITGETRWEVVGDAPNREFVIQFKNWRPSYSSSVTDVAFINFQIRLSETTNQIKIVYGPSGYAIGATTFSGTRQIGLRGATNADFKTRTNTTTQLFTASTAGTGNSSSQAFNTTVTTPGMPTNGLVYTFTPPVACLGTPVVSTVLPANQNLVTTQTSQPLVLQQYAEGTSGLTFQWEQSTDGGTTWTNVTTGTGQTANVYTPVAFAGTNIAYRAKVTCTSSSLFEYSSISTITNCSGLPITTLPWNEGFENLTTFGISSFPMCWFKQNGDWTSRNVPTNYTNARSGSNYITNSWTATNEFIWTPAFALTAGVSYEFSSYVQGDNANTWQVDFFVNTTNSGTGATQLGASYSPPGVSASATIGFQPYFKVRRTFIPETSGTYYFAVRVNEPTGSPWYVAFDDFTVEETPTCIEPTGVTNSNVQATTATISWVAPTTVPASGYEYFVSTSNQLPTSTGTAAATTTASLTNLLPNTVYFVYVRSVCGANEFSSWGGPTSFRTQCEGITELSENFDALTATGTTIMPDCWTRGLIGSASVYVTTGSAAPMTPANRIYMFATAVAPATEAYAILPPLSNLQANTHRLRFKAHSSIVGRTIEIGYLTDPNNLTTYTTIDVIVLPGTAASSALEFNIIPGALPPGVRHLAFRNNGLTGTSPASTTAYIDDVFWEAIPTCNEPSALTVSSVTSNSVVLGWTEADSATAWEIQYGAPGFTLGTGTIVSANSNPFTLNSLTPNTNYVYYVRAICSVSESSFWTGPFAFKTQCNEVTEFSENFDSLTSNFSTTMPDCWGRGLVGTPSLYVTTGSTLPMSPSNRLYMFVSSTATPAQQAYAILPSVSNLAAGTHRLRFKAFATAADRYLEIGYLTDTSDMSTFEYLTDIQLPGTAVANTQQFVFVPPTSIPAGVKSLVILNPGFPTGSSGIYIDDVSWEVIPTCVEPSGVTLGSVLATTATLNWTAASPAPAEGYEYYLSTTSTNPDATTVATGAVGAGITTANLTELTPSTVYYVWVRSVCSTSDKSAWTVITTFTTPCASFVPYYLQNFTTYTSNATLEALCWSRLGSGDQITGPTGSTNAGSWTSDSWLNGTGSTGAARINIFTTTIRGWLVTPIFDLTTGGYQVKYKVGATQYAATTPITSGPSPTLGSDDFVYFMMSTNGGATWTILETYSATNTPSHLGESKIYNIPSVNTNAVKFAFYGTSGTVTEGQDLDFFIDDFEVQTIPVSAPDCATNVTATIDVNCGNVATVISWNPASGSDGYKLTIGTTAGGNDVLNNFVVGGTSYPFVGSINTTYYFKVVPFNANGDATGCTEQSFTTALNGCYCTSAPTLIDASGMTNALIGTTNFPIAVTSAPYYFNLTATPITLNQNMLANVQLTYNTGSWPYTTYIWIDLNDNFIFEPSELMFQGIAPGVGVLNASFTLPASAALGTHRMRISGGDGLGNNPCFSGSYAITLDFIVNVIEEDLSTGSFDTASFKAYPNPVKDIFNFAYSNVISDLNVYNLLGQQVLATKPNANQGQVDMSALPDGTYLVKVTSDNQTKTIKVIKN